MAPKPRKRPYSKSYLRAYSREHVRYEFGMLLSTSALLTSGEKLDKTDENRNTLIRNALIEAFAIHLRNVIEFLYDDSPKQTDVGASDYFLPDQWARLRKAKPRKLNTAANRANKQIAHLTSARRRQGSSLKNWNIPELIKLLVPVMRRMAQSAISSRIAPELAEMLE